MCSKEECGISLHHCLNHLAIIFLSTLMLSLTHLHFHLGLRGNGKRNRSRGVTWKKIPRWPCDSHQEPSTFFPTASQGTGSPTTECDRSSKKTGKVRPGLCLLQFPWGHKGCTTPLHCMNLLMEIQGEWNLLSCTILQPCFWAKFAYRWNGDNNSRIFARLLWKLS